jgi:hypothetical protein
LSIRKYSALIRGELITIRSNQQTDSFALAIRPNLGADRNVTEIYRRFRKSRDKPHVVRIRWAQDQITRRSVNRIAPFTEEHEPPSGRSSIRRPAEEDVMLQFDVFDNVLAAWAWRPGEPRPSEPLVLAIDERFTEGTVGIDYWAQVPNGMLGNAVFRFVHVSDTHIDDPSCDFTDEGFCDVHDIDRMFASGDIASGISVPPADSQFDLNADGVANGEDVEQWLSEAAIHNGFTSPYHPGDANLDGQVDAIDLNQVALNWGHTDVVSWAQGDFNGDRKVNAIDLNALALNWQQSISVTGVVSVPEPAGWFAFVTALAWTRNGEPPL